LTTRQVAALLGVSSETILRRWREGSLPGFRIGTNALRFDADELDAWLEERHRGGYAQRQPPVLAGGGQRRRHVSRARSIDGADEEGR
jgi:excisionase family DNA binding protein